MSAVFDCQTCGACCYGPHDYVDVKVADLKRLTDRVVARYLAQYGGRYALKMVHGHCAALNARQGHYSCRIYGMRPDACRIVEAGSDECLTARRKRNVG